MAYKRATWILFAAAIALAVVPVNAQTGCPTIPQGWKPAMRVDFWYTSQGSRLMEYNAFKSLKTSSGQLFADPGYLKQFKFATVPDQYAAAAWKAYPDSKGLPIGFAVDKDPSGKTYVGLTCAACHTAAIQFSANGPECLVEGGPSLNNFEAFVTALSTAVNSAVSTPEIEETKKLLSYYLLPKNASGFGRVDAFGHIFNRVTKPASGPKHAADAPVSYPHVWSTPYLDRVQWTSAASNKPPFGPLIRNVGEALGVFGELDLRRLGPRLRYSHSSISIKGLESLEAWLQELDTPAWPATLGGDWAIDKNRAAAGQILYANNCATCHTIWKKPADGSLFPTSHHPIGTSESSKKDGFATSNVATDSYVAKRVEERITTKSKYEDYLLEKSDLFRTMLFKPAAFRQALAPELNADLLLAKAVGLTVIGQKNIAKTFLTGAPLADAEKFLATADDLGRTFVAGDRKPAGYRARPLNGIWATAPYLHNGSVPTLWDLLNRKRLPGTVPASSEEQFRPDTFVVGCREYDPKKAGYGQCTGQGFSTYDTSLVGNGNQGHLWGTQLSNSEKLDLLEYLKTL
jgi:hypothetical protein